MVDPTVNEGANGAMLIDVSAGGTAATVTVVEAESAPLNAVIEVVPFESPLNKPLNGPTVPTILFELTQMTEATIGFPY